MYSLIVTAKQRRSASLADVLARIAPSIPFKNSMNCSRGTGGRQTI
jgi:hypothetical protein